MQHFAAIMFPNQNTNGWIHIAGPYKPPEKNRPAFASALRKMIINNKTLQVAPILTGDLNIHSWEVAEKGVNQQRIEENQILELPSPTTPTYRTGAVTDGVSKAPGRYLPEALSPQEADTRNNDEMWRVYLVCATPTTVLADHHALMVDFTAIQEARMPQMEKYNIKTISTEAWGARDIELRN